MPNIITHAIFAYKVKAKLEHSSMKECITAYKNEFTIGSNGPDFLFFYDAVPWALSPDRSVSELGNKMHNSKVNEFYMKAIEIVKKEENPEMKQAMLSYLAGHLCHWALDKTVHPYIFYHTGTGTGISKGYHHRFESMLDTMMLKKFTNKSIKEFKYSRLCKQGKLSLDAISNYYTKIAEDVYDVTLTKEMISKSLKEWKNIQNYLYDSTGLKKMILTQIEKQADMPWAISGNVVPFKVEDPYDMLNKNRSEWKYPADPSITSNKTFMELFEDAIQVAVDAIHLLNDIVNGKTEDFAMAYFLKDQAYDTGVSGTKEMSEFYIIYEQDNETV